MSLIWSTQTVLPEDPNWPYLDSPWDLFRDCQYYESGAANASIYLGACVLSHLLGFVSAYIFPFVGLVGVLANIFVTYVFLCVFRRPSRQMIYLACVAAADVGTIILFGWIWMFPAKGLPYATGARVYFFILNVNDYSCKIVRYLYSFTSCFSSSLFLITAFDRCLCIYFPIKFSRIPRKRAWEAVGATALFSALVMLPFGVVMEHGISNGKIICWTQEQANALQIYHVLLANSSLLQTLIVIIINIALLIRLKQSVLLRETMSKCPSANREIAASMLLVILSTIVVICALPQSIAYILSTILSDIMEGETGRMAVRVAYNISDLGWQILFFQQASNWALYMKRMKNFRRATFRLLRCQCHLGGGLIEDAFESIHYLSAKARNLTGEIRFARKVPKGKGLRFPPSSIRRRGGVTNIWKMRYTGDVVPAGTNTDKSKSDERNRNGNCIDISGACRYTYRGSMKITTTVSTITPGTIYVDNDSPTDGVINSDKEITRF